MLAASAPRLAEVGGLALNFYKREQVEVGISHQFWQAFVMCS